MRQRRVVIAIVMLLAWVGAAAPGLAQQPVAATGSAAEGSSAGVVLTGSILGGVALSGALAGLVLMIPGASTDCYEGGCLALFMSVMAWPIGAPIGASKLARHRGYEVSGGRLFLASILGAGVGALAMAVVDSETRGQAADWVYAASGLSGHLLTLTFAGRHAVQPPADPRAVFLRPHGSPQGVGLVATWRF